MAAFRGALLDLGGVVYVGDAPLPGAIEAIDRLRKAGIGVRFLTNTTRTPHRGLCRNLARMGLVVEEDELFTPALAARRLLAERGHVARLLVAPALEEDFEGLPLSGQSTALVIGDAGDGFTYEALNSAFRALEDGAEFLALGYNRSFRDEDGGLSLDAGPFVAALEFASRRKATVIGKPEPGFFHAALASMGCAARDALMIGDDVESDVAGAMAAGLSGILVRTGKYQPGAEGHIDPPPTHVADDLAAAVDWIFAH
ncbi:TIGR01458 family HAD-type hydrolase [Novosphingobium mangrovi (ex Huang et al. 2023)]|uniref:Phospholysine phosphohistidine inorganic pyrophosphate phosphatase n=1 Tax=Novosphingobium mangrovi (ex Huang et al. 2023) TaxID=2976432 RepID=A0ABT2I9P0_9SPHN|nr:TIGR01458 family HAD-type hydrolase [Novosphingobium mangrovi (ex Huang et al. 2023)]MCT2401551.1 TIGR01458 family HAD-type hydrolase [Novosphingobium mangrovi (ex Huang et al. 2023)]